MAACDLSHADPPTGRATYTDHLGNTYTIASHAGLDQTLVETIEAGRGGPLEPEPAHTVAGEFPPVGPGASIAAIEPPGGAPAPVVDERLGYQMLLRWPLPATGVTSLFGARTDPLTGKPRFHYGVDLQGGYGQVVQAAASGRIIHAGWNEGHGRQVIIEHPGGWRTSYSHLAQCTVNRGQGVRTGQTVGQLGNSGRSTGPHLHFEVTRWGSHFDPLDVLGTSVSIE